MIEPLGNPDEFESTLFIPRCNRLFCNIDALQRLILVTIHDFQLTNNSPIHKGLDLIEALIAQVKDHNPKSKSAINSKGEKNHKFRKKTNSTATIKDNQSVCRSKILINSPPKSNGRTESKLGVGLNSVRNASRNGIIPNWNRSSGN
uniref:Uncharacterized protein n=1 Tax=Opuntia streptacantha TaxID=393608 RepID=A0A7C9E6M3_OPUST